MKQEEAPLALVVDDDPVSRTLVRHGLDKLGFRRVLEAADGVEAQALMREEQVDVVITDLLMPGLDGLGLIRWANEHRPGSTWIILSSIETFDAAVEAIQVGAFDFLAKPPRVEELEVAVRNVLDHRHLVRERERLFSELEEANQTLAAKVRELEEKSEVIRRDLERAEVIQRALLPTRPPALDGYNLTAVYRPGRHVGGDLYLVTQLGPHHLGVCVADATGHGVSSAMLSVLFHRRLALRDRAGQPLAPAQVLARVNRALCADRIAPGLFLTAAYCLLDLEQGDLVVAAAGHPPVLLRHATGELRRIARTGPALGLVADARFEEVRERLEPGDRLLLVTDGLLADGAGEPWRRLEQALAADADEARSLLERLIEEGAWDAEDRDDTTVLLLEARSGPSHFDNGAGGNGQSRAAAPARRAGPSVLYGESAEASYLAVCGRGTWVESDAFHETAHGLLEESRPLVIDLSACEYLDSTFLGTIHQLVEFALARGKGGLRLQGLQDGVRRAFEELSMTRVLEAVAEPALPLPASMQPLVAAEQAGPNAQLRILRAHEALASLSARNREKFIAVVEAIRAQMAE